MRKLVAAVLTVLAVFGASGAVAASWVEGRHYTPIVPALATSVAPGKVEVAEVLSYGCPACNQFLPLMGRIKAALPPQAQVVYVHASFRPDESWPMFQRAFYTAQTLGLVEKTHEAMFGAVWGRNGPLAIADASGRMKKPAPTISDAARWYAKTTGIDAKKFLDTSAQFSVDSHIRRAEAWMRSARIAQTPTLVINGKYRVEPGNAGSPDDLLALVNWLVAKEVNDK